MAVTGCYLCRPENEPAPGTDEHDEWNEACAECDRGFWDNPVFRMEEHDG